MKKFETISQGLFDERSARAIAVTPLRKEVSLNEIQIIKDDMLQIGQLRVGMESAAFKGICKIVGLPAGFDKTFANTFGDKARQMLINKLKNAVQAKGTSTVSLVLSPETKKIVGVHKDPKELVSNKTFMETATRIIDKNGLEVNGFSIGNDGGVVINTASPKNIWDIPGMNNESFFGGITIANSPAKGLSVSPYMHRLVCSNGMIGEAFQESMNLRAFSGYEMEKFWKNIEELAKRGFKPSKFEDQVRLAHNTKASLSEMEYFHNRLVSLSSADTKEVEAWIPLNSTKSRFHAAGIDTITLSAAQMKGAMTGTTVWDLVNAASSFASNDFGINISDYGRSKLQVDAARMLSKSMDMGNIIPSPFDPRYSEELKFGTKWENNLILS
jgi:hypothetical protein